MRVQHVSIEYPDIATTTLTSAGGCGGLGKTAQAAQEGRNRFTS